MRKLCLLIIGCILTLFLVSCPYGIGDKEKPGKASFLVSLNGTDITNTNANSITFDLDQDDMNKTLVLETKLLSVTNMELTKWNFTFSAPSDCPISEVGNEGRKVSINLANLAVGTYKITAICNEIKTVTATYTIWIKSSLSRLIVSYSLDSQYSQKGLKKEQISGSITELNRSLSLPTNTKYNFVVSDRAGKIDNISNLSLSSTSSKAGFYYTTGDSGSFYLKEESGKTITLTFDIAGREGIAISVDITLEDNSQSHLEPAETEILKEEIYSFIANPNDYLDKAYDYNFVVDTAEFAPRYPKFSIDAEIWNDEAEIAFLEAKNNHKEYIPQINDNAVWMSETEFSVVRNNEEKFKVRVNGDLKKISIIPLKNTTAVYNGTEYNQHFYLYWKWKDETGNSYRGKYRIMVGGVLEDIDLFYYMDSEETKKIPAESHKINAGDQTSFYLHANYAPFNSMQASDKILFYVSESDDEKTYKTFTLNSQSVKLPVPVKRETAVGKCMKINDADLADITDTENINTVAGISYSDGSALDYYSLKSMETGECSLYLRYLDSGETCVFVAVDVRTGIFRTYKLWKDDSSNTVTVKSVNPAPLSLYMYKNKRGKCFYSTTTMSEDDRGTSCTLYNATPLDTSYSGVTATLSDPYIQKYPYTVQHGYEKRRTFFIPYDEVISIDVLSNFEMTSINGELSIEAQTVLGKFQTGISSDPYTASIQVGSQWSVANPDSDHPYMKRIDSCSSDFQGINVDLKINTEFTIPLRFIVYWR